MLVTISGFLWIFGTGPHDMESSWGPSLKVTTNPGAGIYLFTIVGVAIAVLAVVPLLRADKGCKP